MKFIVGQLRGQLDQVVKQNKSLFRNQNQYVMLANSINNKVEAYILANHQHHRKAISHFIHRVNQDNHQHTLKYQLISDLQQELQACQHEMQVITDRHREKGV